MTKSWHQYSKRAPKAARTGHDDGFVYDSKTEMMRWFHLKLLERAGEISKIERQVSYQLSNIDVKVMAGKKVAIYTPDFVYLDKDLNKVIEDVKGYRDEGSKFRIRVFEAFYKQKVKIIMLKGNRWIEE